MSHIWTFSEGSKELLQRCLDAAAPADESNKWMQKFGKKHLKPESEIMDTIVINDTPELEDVILPQNNQQEQLLNEEEDISDPDFDIVAKFNDFDEKSAGISNIKEFSYNLPMNTIEKLNYRVFNLKTINNGFLKRYFKYVLPIFIRRDNSRLSTELLLKTYKLFPNYFKMFLQAVFKDLEIQNNIIHDFILALNSTEQAELLHTITDLDLSSEEFAHHLFNINSTYKSCNKTEITQKCIFSLLKIHSNFCSTDKNYGKLLLAFLQHEKSLDKDINTLVIKGLLEIHKSAFKRPCTAILK